VTALQLLVGLLTLVTNAFFVGGEFSLISVRRSQVEPAAEAGHRRARSVIWGLEHVSVLLVTAQLGVTASSLVLGAAAEPGITHLLEPALAAAGLPDGLIRIVAFIIALTAATYLHMLFGEMVPKNIALAAPERTALLLVPPLVALTRALRPLVFTVNGFASAVLRLLRVQVRDEIRSAFTERELVRMVQDSAGARLLPERDSELLQDILELGGHRVRDVLQPMTAVVCAGPDTTPEDLELLSARTGYSRFPVRDGDRLLGYLHVKDALHYTPGDRPFPPHALRPIAQVPADTPLDEIITAMRRSGTHLAAVTGTGGAPAGLVTMEDALSELLGRPQAVQA
jgi:CBS domain containing-hemolysin-like protein